MAKSRRGSWFQDTAAINRRVDKEVAIEFSSVCNDIGVAEGAMLNEVLKTFIKEMRHAQKYNVKTIYGDLFPTYGSGFDKK